MTTKLRAFYLCAAAFALLALFSGAGFASGGGAEIWLDISKSGHLLPIWIICLTLMGHETN